jgi:uncharacterized protein YdhG (YjbR/CyaY superfamily)
MAERKAAKTTKPKASETFTAEERAAMRETARERRRPSKDGEADILAKIAEMPKADRDKAKKVHAIVKDVAPGLAPRTWYGMPAYTKDDKVVCFFRSADKFKSRYAALGFSDKANLDDGAMWATDFAIKDLTAAEEKKIRALVKKAVRD